MAKKEQGSYSDEGKGEQGEVAQAEVEEIEEIESLKKALAEAKGNSEKYLANWQRAQADFINFKRRNEQERTDVVNYANSTLILNLLPVLDDLERALVNVPGELTESPWVDGIRHIYRKLQSFLQAQGVSAIEAEGKDFDPNFHEAVMAVDGEEGKIMEEIQRGYKLRNRVIRPTRVAVGKGRESPSNNKSQ